MMLANAIKTVCDFLLFFSFASLIDSYRGAWLLMGTVTALAFLSSLILQKTKKSLPARIICGLIPVLGLYTARSTSDMVITGVVLAFYAVLTIYSADEIYYEEYKTWFGFPAIFVTVMFVICFSEWPIRPESTILGALYLFLGVLVLRSKRIGQGARFRLKMMNFVEISGIVAIGALLCMVLYGIVSHSGKVFEVLFMPVGAVFYLLVSLASQLGVLMKQDPEEKLFHPKKPDVNMEEIPRAEDATPDIADKVDYNLLEILGKATLVIIILLILIYLLYIFYKMVRKLGLRGKGSRAEIEEGIEEQEASFFNPFGKKKKRRTLSNNEKIRQIYKDYLLIASTFGVNVERQTTSMEVAIASEAIITPEKARDLRELYIRARYKDLEELSDEEVVRAKTLYDEIKEELLQQDIRQKN